MVTSGLARRFQYQSGLRSDPAFEANTRYRSPSARYIIGLIRGCPLRAPTVWRSNSGAPAKLPPTRPWLARNSAMVRWLNWSAGLVNECPLVGRGCPEERLAGTQ